MKWLKRGNPWERALLYPKHGNVRCELLKQQEKECATYAVAQCLVAMGIDADPEKMEAECRRRCWVWKGKASSPKYNLEAAVELGYISEYNTKAGFNEFKCATKDGPVVLALSGLPSGFMLKDGFNFIGSHSNWATSSGKHATCCVGYKKPLISEGYFCLMDTAVGRVYVSEGHMKELFERGAVCYVPVK